MNFYRINRGIYKRLHSYFIFLSRNIQYRNKVNKKIKELNCDPLTKEQIRETKEYYRNLGFKNINTNWHRYFTHVSGRFYKEYIPEDLFHNIIEPNLNMIKMLPALTDKNLLIKLFNLVKQPNTVIRSVNGFYYDGNKDKIIQINEVEHRCSKYTKLIIKPSIDSGGGKNIIAFNIEGNKTDFKNMTIKEIIQLYGKNFIIQEWLIQNKSMNSLNPSSVNTLRIKSILLYEEVEVLSCVVRIGGKDSFIDNIKNGGIYCHVNPNGRLNEKGYLINSKFVLKTNTNIKLKDFIIPNYDKILKDVKSLHIQIPYFKIISWDVAIDKQGNSVLIEYNVEGQGIEGQYRSGPLFGKYTDEILRNCKIKKFSKIETY